MMFGCFCIKFIEYMLKCIAFIKFMLKGKILLEYTNLFSPNEYKNINKIIYNYFKDKHDQRKHKTRL